MTAYSDDDGKEYVDNAEENIDDGDDDNNGDNSDNGDDEKSTLSPSTLKSPPIFRNYFKLRQKPTFN